MSRATISRAEVMAFARSLGVDPLQTRHIDVAPHEITVTSYRLDEKGNRHRGPDGEVATDVAVIKVVGPTEGSVRMRHPNLDAEIDVPASAVGHHAVAGWEAVTPPEPEVTPAEYERLLTEVEGPPEKDDTPEPPAPDDQPSTPPRRRKSKGSE